MFKSNTLTLTITNNTKQLQPWVAFGYNIPQQNPPGVLVNVAESSLLQASTQSSQQPFKVKSIKFNSRQASQLNNPITILTSDATGYSKSVTLIPSNYLTPMSSIPSSVKIYNPKIAITAKVQFSGTINPSEQMVVVIELWPKSKFSSFIETVLLKRKNWQIGWKLLPI